MNNYKIACMVKSSGRYIEKEFLAYTLSDALIMFASWLNLDCCMSLEALCELDISEVVNGTDA